MNHAAIYNEIEPFAANWIERLAERGHIARGGVDRRSIADLTAADVDGPGQRHFFAGIGGWSYALRLAGVADDADVWTGSCPCQPFSNAGAGLGIRDPRHLWPAWFELIRECRPSTIFGEQVASRAGLAWLDLVRSDLEGCGYSFGASDLCAASVGAPHIRQRLYFVAYADNGNGRQRVHIWQRGPRQKVPDVDRRGTDGRMGDTGRDRARQHARELPRDESEHGERSPHRDHAPVDPGAAGGVGDAMFTRLQGGNGRDGTALGSCEPAGAARGVADAGRVERGPPSEFRADAQGATERRESAVHPEQRRGVLNPWESCDWIPCIDGVSRPVEPGTFPLAHGVPARVGRLRGYGNAIIPQVAAAFITAALDAIEEQTTVISTTLATDAGSLSPERDRTPPTSSLFPEDT